MTTSIQSLDAANSALLVGGVEAARFSSSGISTPGIVAPLLTANQLNGAGFGAFRNKIQNGKMTINQRAPSQPFPAGGGATWLVDRWGMTNNTSATGTVSQNNENPIVGGQFGWSARVVVGVADTSIAAGEFCVLNQVIEGFNIQDLVGNTFTLSFWVKSSKVGIHCVSMCSSNGDRSYVLEYAINAANTWEFKSHTVVGGLLTAGTWNYTNDLGLYCRWNLANGSTYHGTTGWNVGTNAQSTPNQVNFMDTVGNVFALTGVQLERGAVATPFEHIDHGVEYGRCLRYQVSAAGLLIPGQCFTTVAGMVVWNAPVPMRTSPTLSPATGHSVITAGGGGIVCSQGAPSYVGPNVYRIDFSGATGLTPGNITYMIPLSNTYFTALL